MDDLKNARRKVVQAGLILLRCTARGRLHADGDRGDFFTEALWEFQEANNLPQTGIFDAETARIFCKLEVFMPEEPTIAELQAYMILILPISASNLVANGEAGPLTRHLLGKTLSGCASVFSIPPVFKVVDLEILFEGVLNEGV